MLLTVKEAADLMRVSARTIRREIQDGQLQAKRLGRQLRLPIDQFSDFVDVTAVRAEIIKRANKAGING